jgi:putative transcriptional regulator
MRARATAIRGANGRMWAVVALVLLAAAGLFAPPVGAQILDLPVKPQDVVGRVLVASPSMTDVRFRNAIIYIARHDAQGAFGLVVNRPQGVGPLEQVLRAFRLRADPTEARVTVYWGGPVEPGRGFVLHSTDYGVNGALMVAGNLAVSRVESIAVAIAEGRGPRATLMAFGYTNWGAGQLDREVNNGDWYVVPQDQELIFVEPDATKWKRAYSAYGVDL